MNLAKHEKDKFIKEIQQFFYDERGEELGIIGAENILEFFLKDLGKLIYNKSLDDAKTWFVKRMEDIEYDYDTLYK